MNNIFSWYTYTICKQKVSIKKVSKNIAPYFSVSILLVIIAHISTDWNVYNWLNTVLIVWQRLHNSGSVLLARWILFFFRPLPGREFRRSRAPAHRRTGGTARSVNDWAMFGVKDIEWIVTTTYNLKIKPVCLQKSIKI